MESHHVIKRPLLTEKTTWSSNEANRHGFIVDRRATKTDIKRAVQELYGVRVVGVSTLNRRSRNRRYRYGAVAGKVTKKAIVRVHADDTLEIL
jgi:large subunit ribosomal protein L23